MSDPASECQYGIAVPIKEVERELARQMKALQDGENTPVLRARMSNLVIYCNRRDIATGIMAQIPDIGIVHPARVILLIADAEVDKLQAWVCVRAHRMGNKAQATSEQVTVTAPVSQLERLPFAVRALAIGDLPTNLWWASIQPPPFAGALLYELAENAQQIMYDSLGWLEPARGVAATATWLDQVERTSGVDRWRVASDLNWRRLKWWRRLVAQALDAASAPGAKESISEVLVEHGPHAVVQAWELVSVLSHLQGWQVQAGKVQLGVEMAWTFTAPHGEVRVRLKRLAVGPAEIRGMRIVCQIDGQPAALNLVAESDQRLAIVPEGTGGEPRTMTLPSLTPAELIGRQLSDRERDPVFRESMAVAQVMAQSVL